MEEFFGLATTTLVSVWTDTPAEAVSHLRRFLREPAAPLFTRYDLANDLFLYPLWGHPEFEALIADDEAWGPIFEE